jgi:hypothetical protein
MTSWAPPAPTQDPPSPSEDGSRTSVAFAEVIKGANLLGMSSGDPTKVLKRLVAFCAEHQQDALADPTKREQFFVWFKAHMHDTYMDWLRLHKLL